MKPILLVCLLVVATPLLAAEDPSVPSSEFCFQVNGFDSRVRCSPTPDDSASPASPMVDRMRDSIWLLAFEVDNSSLLSPPPPGLGMRRGFGRLLMSAASAIAFPELGDPITEETPAVAYCSSTVGKGLSKPFDAASVKAMGKGRCAEVMIVYVKGLSEGC